MYQVLRDQIEGGGHALSDLVVRIDTMWCEGQVSSDEREELIALARERARPEDSFASNEERILALETALRDLSGRVAALEGGGQPGGGEADDWPEWVQPLGAMDAYPAGARVTFAGRRYTSLIDANVWSPAAYPAGWEGAD